MEYLFYLPVYENVMHYFQPFQLNIQHLVELYREKLIKYENVFSSLKCTSNFLFWRDTMAPGFNSRLLMSSERNKRFYWFISWWNQGTTWTCGGKYMAIVVFYCHKRSLTHGPFHYLYRYHRQGIRYWISYHDPFRQIYLYNSQIR